MSEIVLEMKNISKKFSDFYALKNVDFQLARGEVHVLLGENGAGKSTLMKILGGVYKKDEGNITIKGQDVEISSPQHAQKLGISMIFQDSNLCNKYTVAENIFINSKPISNKLLRTIDFKKMYVEAEKILNELGFQLNSNSLVSSLNAGQKQMVEIAKAVNQSADILIMDEPNTMLTQKESAVLFEVIGNLKKKGVSIIYISHRLEEIFQIADRISILRDGEMMATASIGEIDVNEILQNMSGADYKNRYPKLDIKIGGEVLKVESLSVGNYIKNVNFSLKKGEVLGFAGLLGSGRTKIARSIFGLEQICCGNFYIYGKKAVIRSPLDAINYGIGYISESKEENIFPNLNILYNITSASSNEPTSDVIIRKSTEHSISQRFLTKFNVKNHSVCESIENLSGGNQQKAVLARWVLTNTRIFIFDEPTIGLDISSKVDVYNIISNLVREGMSVILISSDIGELVGMCDRILVIFDGSIVKEFKRNEAAVKNILYYAVGGNLNK